MAENKKAPFHVRLNAIDRLISYIDPIRGLNRVRAKAVMSSLSSMGYVGGSKSRRSMLGWITGGNDADSTILPQLPELRNRSRDLYCNAPLGTGALKRIRTNAVGPGLTLQCRIDRRILGLTDIEAEAWERDTEVRFRAWAESKDCDLVRTQNFYDLQGLAFLSALMSGDVFALMPRKETKGMDNNLRISLYESDFVSNPNYGMDADTIAGGIETDENQTPIAYHFSNRHPGNPLNMPSRWIRVQAFGEKSGRRQVIHLYSKERPGQRRGVPLLAPVIESIKQLSRYSESELMAAVVTSFFTVFVKQQTKGGDPLQSVINGGNPGDFNMSNPGDQPVVNANNPSQQNMYELGNGNIVGLGEGEDVSFADPKRPNSAFDAFFTAVVRQIGSAIEVPYEQLILHFSSSYSASRAALLEAWKFFRIQRNFVSRNFCAPVYEEWLYEEILTGRILAPGYFTDNLKRFAWQCSQWQGPGQGQIQPVQETQAALMKIAGNLSTYETEHNSIHGGVEGNWDASMDRKSREESFLKEKGLLIRDAKQIVVPEDKNNGNQPGNNPDGNGEDA